MIQSLKKEWRTQVAVAFFILLTAWWVTLNLSGVKESFHNYIFGAAYGLMAMLGGVWAIDIARKWGMTKSVMGRAILALSLGLLAEEFGQIVFSFYNIFLHVEIPYPSFADIGFFGNIPLYIVGIMLLAKAAGIQFTLKKNFHKLQIVLLPAIMLIFSYVLFLQNYEFDWSNLLRIFLDFGYPLGQAIYVSIALLIYSLSKNILGGIMKSRILFLLIAFVAQYIADFNFLFQNSRGTWLNGGYGDYLYLMAYFLMTLGLLQLNTVLGKLRNRDR